MPVFDVVPRQRHNEVQARIFIPEAEHGRCHVIPGSKRGGPGRSWVARRPRNDPGWVLRTATGRLQGGMARSHTDVARAQNGVPTGRTGVASGQAGVGGQCGWTAGLQSPGDAAGPPVPCPSPVSPSLTPGAAAAGGAPEQLPGQLAFPGLEPDQDAGPAQRALPGFDQLPRPARADEDQELDQVAAALRAADPDGTLMAARSAGPLTCCWTASTPGGTAGTSCTRPRRRTRARWSRSASSGRSGWPTARRWTTRSPARRWTASSPTAAAAG